MKKVLFLTISLMSAINLFAQNVGIGTNTPDASAKLDVVDSNRGLLIPRVALTATNASGPVTSPATSLLVYNTATAGTPPNNVWPGYYYWDGAQWVRLSNNQEAWQLLGNAGTVDGTHFLGTTDAVPMNFRVDNQKAGRIGHTGDGSTFLGYQAGNNDDYSDNRNTYVGYQSGFSTTTGFWNTAVGYGSLYTNSTGVANTVFGYEALFSNSTGTKNTAFGFRSSYNNTTGENNVAYGFGSLYTNTTGNNNTALGYSAVYHNSIGTENTGVGYMSLFNNTTASRNIAIGHMALFTQSFNNGGTAWNSDNVAIGFEALYSNQPTANNNGNQNTAIGTGALRANSVGNFNSALGAYALYNNTTGVGNTAVGQSALVGNTTGNYNTAVGQATLVNNTSGSYNVAIGQSALLQNTTGSFNVAVGQVALHNNTSGDFNIAIGQAALFSNTTGNQNIAIGQAALNQNISGVDNTALGQSALLNNVTGNRNSAFGQTALNKNLGNQNTAVGASTAYENTTGNDNTAIGQASLRENQTGSENVAIGQAAGFGLAGVNFNQCTFVGSKSSPTVNRTNVTMLGYGIGDAQCTGDNQVLLGNTAITQIRAQVNSITTYSDKRFKFNIQEDVPGLDFINRLKPVTYNQNPEILHQIWGTPDSLAKKIDHSEIKQKRFIGFIAQEVDKAAKECNWNFPGIDIPQNENQVYSLRYGDFIMPLVKSVQELSSENQKLKAENALLKAKLEEQQKQIDAINAFLGIKAQK